MALTARQRKGIEIGAGGLIGLIVGAIFFFVPATPDWLAVGLQAIGAVAGIIGFNIVLPNIDPPA